LAELREQSLRGVPPHLLLDRLATGLSIKWPVAAQLLRNTNIIVEPIDDEIILAVEEARGFWIHYSEARARFDAFLRMRSLISPAGDWGLFSHEQLHAILSNLTLPDHCQRRRGYLTNYIHSEQCLDIHGPTSLPLVRHPFPAEFNPLVFGRPPRLALV
jgi:hypothetical protein